MLVCRYCLQAIESHEGRQIVGRYVYTPSEEEVAECGEDTEPYICEWCEEPFFDDELYDI